MAKQMSDQRFFQRLQNWVKANNLAFTEIIQQKSWLRSARQAQNLKGIDMAKRMGVSPARISMMEKDELRGAVTIKMMQKAAQALDCEFVYAVVPKKALKRDEAELAEKPRMRVQQ